MAHLLLGLARRLPNPKVATVELVGAARTAAGEVECSWAVLAIDDSGIHRASDHCGSHTCPARRRARSQLHRLPEAPMQAKLSAFTDPRGRPEKSSVQM